MRKEKKSRIKGLPPRVQLTQQEAKTGSLPTKFRVASDNRTGKYDINYNDRDTIEFRGYQFDQTKFPHKSNVVAYYTFENFAIYKGFTSLLNLSTKLPGDLEFLPQIFDVSENQGFSKTQVSGVFEGGRNAAKNMRVSASAFDGIFSTNHHSIKNFNFSSGSALRIHDANSLVQSVFDFSSGSDDKPFTFSFWYKHIGDFPTANDMVLATRKALSEVVYEMGVSSSGDMYLELVDNKASSEFPMKASGSITLENNKWNHLAFSYDGSKSIEGISLYKNGIEIQSSGTKDSTYNVMQSEDTESDIRVWFANNDTSRNTGNDPLAGAKGINGYLNDVLVLNKFMSGSEIRNDIINRKELLTAPYDGVNWGSGLNVSSRHWNLKEQATDIFVSGSVRKGVGDQIADFTPGQNFEPFKEQDNPELDGKTNHNPFYATGSAIEKFGPGFEQPLWSKSKIEIDLTPSKKHSFGINDKSGSNTNFPMAYWNKDKKVFEGIGTGKPMSSSYSWQGSQEHIRSNVNSFLREQTLGFNMGYTEPFLDKERARSLGHYISNLGFPYHIKFHATSSNLIDMGQFITKPFIVEKAVLIFSGALDPKNTQTVREEGASVTNFFVLNQKPKTTIETISPTVTFVSGNSSMSRSLDNIKYKIPSSSMDFRNGDKIKSRRDFIINLQISNHAFKDLGEFATPRDEINRLLSRNLFISGSPAKGWSGNLIVTGSVYSPVSTIRPSVNTGLSTNGIQIRFTADERVDGTPFAEHGFLSHAEYQGRTGLSFVSGRSLLNTIKIPQSVGAKAFANLTDKFSINNPYILQSTDKLIIGWQVPYNNIIVQSEFTKVTDTQGWTLEFDNSVPSKLILYGSELQNNEEKHDTLNQLLSSNTVHEVIGDD